MVSQSSADAGERLATLRGHYEQHIKELGQQLAQQDVQFHAALAARSCAAVSSVSRSAAGAPAAAIVQRLSLEEALADPLGSQGPSFFTLPRDSDSPSSGTADANETPLDCSPKSSGLPRTEGRRNHGMILRPNSAETLVFPLATAPSAASAPARQYPPTADESPSGENKSRTTDSPVALQGAGGSPAIPIFVLDDNENPWL